MLGQVMCLILGFNIGINIRFNIWDQYWKEARVPSCNKLWLFLKKKKTKTVSEENLSAAMAAGKSEIDSFMSKFFQLLHSGESAQLTFECYNGQYFVNLRAALQHNSEQQYQHYHHHHQQRQRPSPSRLRRRARRRAAACDRDATTSDTVAAKAASADKAESNIETISGKIDVAVQVSECECPVPVLSKESRDDSISQLVDKAVQVRDQGTPLRSLHHHHQVVQGQRCDLGEAATISAEQAVRAHTEPAGDTVIADFNQDTALTLM